jgi:hypothetical protein
MKLARKAGVSAVADHDDGSGDDSDRGSADDSDGDLAASAGQATMSQHPCSYCVRGKYNKTKNLFIVTAFSPHTCNDVENAKSKRNKHGLPAPTTLRQGFASSTAANVKSGSQTKMCLATMAAVGMTASKDVTRAAVRFSKSTRLGDPRDWR